MRASEKTKGGENMKMLSVDDVQRELAVKKATAYKIISKLNQELTEKGYMTAQGRVPERYFRERFYL